MMLIVCADATHLPFKERCFDTVVSLETLEHIKDQRAFLYNIKVCLKRNGRLILSTPNKMYSSPLLPKPLNLYHTREHYLGTLLKLLSSCGFRIRRVYGGKNVSNLELLRRVLGSLLKFLLSKLSVKPYVVDNFYRCVLHLLSTTRKYTRKVMLVDPDPNLITHEELEATSNIIPSKYFIVYAELI